MGILKYMDEDYTGFGEMNVQSDWNQSDSTKDDYIKNKPTPTVENLTWDQQSGTIKLIRFGKIRMLVFDDAKLPSNVGYFSPSTTYPFSGSDAPIALTTSLLSRGGSSLFSFWVGLNGSIGQSGGVANGVVNGYATWITN